MIGSSAVVALIPLPASGIALTRLAVAALLATGAVAISLLSFSLRFIDHRA